MCLRACGKRRRRQKIVARSGSVEIMVLVFLAQEPTRAPGWSHKVLPRFRTAVGRKEAPSAPSVGDPGKRDRLAGASGLN